MEPRQPALAARLLAAVPNALSLSRLALGIAFPWVPASWRVPIILAGALSDLLDGLVSRLFHARSTAGRILDPLADKVFVFSVVVALWNEGSLKSWEVVLVGLRDLTVLAGVVLVLLRTKWHAFPLMPPSLMGKATTVAQFLFLLILLVRPQQAFAVFLLAATLSGLTAGDYIRVFFTTMPGGPERGA